MRIQAEPLKRLTGDVFAAAGCSAAESGRIAHYLVGSNLAGHDSHGVIRIPRYLSWMREGMLMPDQTITIESENAVMAIIDGHFGFGQSVGPQAVELGMEKAKVNGVSVIALRNSGHLGRIGDWPEMAARAGYVSIHFVNGAGSLLVAPFGSVERRTSTNPFAAGVPVADAPPFIVDFATSVVAEGKIIVAAKGGKPLPPGALIDTDGSLSADPSVLYGDADTMGSVDDRSGTGAIRAMGEHKGSGLSLLCELLAGALTGSGCAQAEKRRFANGMLSVYMSVDAFDSNDFFAAEVRRFLDFVKSAKPASPGGEVLTPGEPERRARERRLADGIELPDDAWAAIREAACGIGLDRARIDATLAR